jgi:hypothetical protein
MTTAISPERIDQKVRAVALPFQTFVNGQTLFGRATAVVWSASPTAAIKDIGLGACCTYGRGSFVINVDRVEARLFAPPESSTKAPIIHCSV